MPATGCALVLITIATSGGIGGFGLSPKEKSVETESLAEPVRQDVCRRFDPKELERLSASSGHPSSADRVTYHVTVTDDAGRKHRFDIPEAALPAETIDLMDEF